MYIRVFVFLTTIFVCAAGVCAQGNSGKKNSRPTESKVIEKPAAGNPQTPVYFYEFEKPEFLVSFVRIEHDENGLGKITFRKKELDEEFTLPIEISETATANLKTHWENLDFLNSDKSYQSKLDYPHLGKMTLKMVREEAGRTAEFNWTEDSDALFLTEEYKKIANEYVWMFDLEVAIRNQPLMTPKIMNQLDLYLRRDRISDPAHMLPYLRKLVDDERMPMISRNHAKRLADQIVKQTAKK